MERKAAEVLSAAFGGGRGCADSVSALPPVLCTVGCPSPLSSIVGWGLKGLAIQTTAVILMGTSTMCTWTPVELNLPFY